MKLTAQVIPWSSIVGTGVLLMDEKGRCIGQLALHNVFVSSAEDRKAVMVETVQTVADMINAPKRTSDTARWSGRKKLLFIIGVCSAFWAAVLYGIMHGAFW